MKCLTWRHSFCISEVSPEEAKAIFNKLILQAGFGVVGFMEHHFSADSPYGSYAATWVLAESHFTLRIFPRKGIIYCEVSSCILGKYVEFLGLVEPMMVSTTKLEFWSHQLTVSQTDGERLKGILNRLIPKATFKIVKFAECIFPGGGGTYTWLGEDSHLNAHTFPEDGKSVIEVGSFNRGRYLLMIRMLDEESIKKMSLMA
jgi:S-adenosylmethionine/arginine decarboxylase-like enzyme